MEEIPTWQCVVAGALRDQEGRWLMHRRPPGKHHGGLWEFPGGKVEPEETPQISLVRELLEELGVTVDLSQTTPIGFAEERAGSRPRPIVILLYTVLRWDGVPRAMEQGGEVEWFSPDEISALERPPLDRELCKSLFGASLENSAR